MINHDTSPQGTIILMMSRNPMAASGRSETAHKLPVSIAQWIEEVEICMILDTCYYLNANFPNFSKPPQIQL